MSSDESYDSLARVPLISLNSSYSLQTSMHQSPSSSLFIDADEDQQQTHHDVRSRSKRTSRRYVALMKKNVLLLQRQKMITFCQFVIPLILTIAMGAMSSFIKLATQDLIINANPNYTVPLSNLQAEGNFFLVSVNNHPELVGDLNQNGNHSSGVLGEIPQASAADGSGFYPYAMMRSSRSVIINEIIDRKEKYITEVSNGFVPSEAVPAAFIVFDRIAVNGSRPNSSVQFEVGVEQQIGYPNTANYTSVQMAALQLVTNAFLSYVTNGSFSIKVDMKAFPTYSKANLIDASLLAGLFYPLALSFFIPIFVYTIVLEKQLGLSEMMHLMGMKKRHYWLVTYLFDMSLYVLVLILVIAFSSAFKLALIIKGSWLVNILLFLGWGNAQIALSFFISTFFAKTRTATTISSFLVIISVIVSLALNNTVLGTEPASWTKFLMLYPPFSFYRAISLLGLFCGLGDCPQLHDFVWANEITQLCFSLYVASIVLFLLTGYLDNVMPRQWGVAKSPFFIFFPLLRMCGFMKNNHGYRTSSSTTGLLDEPEDAAQERSRVYNARYSSTCSVVISDLHKQFKDGKVAVHNLCLAIESGECFGFLGPNGAGKTTTISMLTGSIPPTSGTITIAGLDSRNNIDEIRACLGVCPQFDILWDQLTPRETILFFSRLKGVPADKEEEQTEMWLTEVGLREYADVLVKELSGGERRKISIVAALVGNPRIIILDEPTTGLDPVSRRLIWELLLKIKRGRCLLLTTHSMEEADILCNRIGIISRGKLLCLGPQAQLKQKFGVGYRLYISFEPKDEQRASTFVKNAFPSSVVSENFAGYHVYRLPYQSALISEVFEIMESNKMIAGIKEWGISPASLEDVFMQVVVPSQQIELS